MPFSPVQRARKFSKEENILEFAKIKTQSSFHTNGFGNNIGAKLHHNPTNLLAVANNVEKHARVSEMSIEKLSTLFILDWCRGH